MADQLQQTQTVGPTANATPARGAEKSRHPATSMVETMLSRGEREPGTVASIMNAYPGARDEILALLHAVMGNLFVQDVAARKADEAPKAAAVPLGPVRVTASSLRVRSSPSAASQKNVVGRLTRGSVVTAQGKDGDWLRIEHDGQTCFVHGDHVASVAAPTQAPPKAGGEEDDGGHEQAAAPPVVAPTVPVAAPQIAAPTASPVAPTKTPLPTQVADATPAPTAAPATPVTPAPVPAPTTTSPAQTTAAPASTHVADALGGTYKGVFDKIYRTGSQVSQVWVSAGGLSATPNIYVHFHGHRTDYGIDDDLEWHEGGMKENKKTKQMYQAAPKANRKKVDKGGSGHRAAKEAMAAAAGQNTIAILPQGVLGEGAGGVHEGGYMKDLETLGLAGFLEKILKPLAKDLGLPHLSPGNIALGGHSAGGYEGIHSAMRRLDDGEKDAELMDKITDVTLYDASYGSGAHLDETRTWAFHEGPVGTPTKNVRIVNGWAQQSSKKDDHKAYDLWFARFGEPNLKKSAAKQGMTIRPVGDVGTKLDKETTIMQHTQVVRGDGSIQADVLVLQFSRPDGNDHENLRDREIDDAIMSIGDGVAGNAQFGRHHKGKLAEKAAGLKQEEANDAAESDHHEAAPKADATMPQPKHVEGDDRAKPEKVEEAPAVKSPPKKAVKAQKRDEEREQLFDELYNEKTGRVRADKLGRSTTTTVKNKQTKKKEKVTINLTDEQYEFKQQCYRLATQKMTGRLYGGVDKEDLQTISGTSEQIRKEAIGDLDRLMSAARAAGHTITVGSGYRPPEEDMGIWSRGFDTMYLWETQKVRRERWPDDEYGQAAAEYLVDQIKGRKAPPGKSNHSNGIAVDFLVTENGKEFPNKYNDQKQWRASKVFKWLKEHCGSYNFKNLATEAWHYDWKP